MKQLALKQLALFVFFVSIAGSLPAVAKNKGQLTGVVNINEASVAELTMLPGIGAKRAQAIVAYRQAHPFKNAEELKSIKGIGQKGFETLKPFLSVVGPTTAQFVKAPNPTPAATPSKTASK